MIYRLVDMFDLSPGFATSVVENRHGLVSVQSVNKSLPISYN